MKKINTLHFSSFLITILFFSGQVFAQFTNGQSADLGQPDFTTGSSGVGIAKMNYPFGLAINPISGACYVSDSNNSRVLRFPATLVSSMNADKVLGQSDFDMDSSSTSASTLKASSGSSFDSNGNLWVADYYNYRVLMFRDADNKANGALADLVLGQADFNSAVSSISQTGISSPEAIHIDTTGRLWVADSSNNRVVWYDNAENLSNGAPANGVLGQSDFTGSGEAATADRFSYPSGVFVDKSNHLWIIDCGNNRVLRFDNPNSLATGASANAVLGQTDFITTTHGTSASQMYCPYRSTVDSLGTLWVTDYGNNRVLGFLISH